MATKITNHPTRGGQETTSNNPASRSPHQEEILHSPSLKDTRERTHVKIDLAEVYA